MNKKRTYLLKDNLKLIDYISMNHNISIDTKQLLKSVLSDYQKNCVSLETYSLNNQKEVYIESYLIDFLNLIDRSIYIDININNLIESHILTLKYY